MNVDIDPYDCGAPVHMHFVTEEGGDVLFRRMVDAVGNLSLDLVPGVCGTPLCLLGRLVRPREHLSQTRSSLALSA